MSQYQDDPNLVKILQDLQSRLGVIEGNQGGDPLTRATFSVPLYNSRDRLLSTEPYWLEAIVPMTLTYYRLDFYVQVPPGSTCALQVFYEDNQVSDLQVVTPEQGSARFHGTARGIRKGYTIPIRVHLLHLGGEGPGTLVSSQLNVSSPPQNAPAPGTGGWF